MAQPVRPVWSIEVSEAGAINSSLFIRSASDRPLTPEQAAEARLRVDEALARPENAEWLEAVNPWVVNDGLRVWWRSISGLRSETRALVTRLNRTGA